MTPRAAPNIPSVAYLGVTGEVEYTQQFFEWREGWMIPIADALYDEHLETLRREGELS